MKQLLFVLGLMLVVVRPAFGADAPPPSAGRVWGDAVAQRWIPVILSGVALAALNQYYWALRYRKRVAEIRVQKMIEAYSAVGTDLAQLLNRLNQLVDVRHKKSSPHREHETAAVQEEMQRCAADLSLQLAAVKLYFGGRSEGAANTIIALVQKTSSDIMDGEKSTYIRVGDPLFEAAMTLQDELRRSLRRALHQQETRKTGRVRPAADH
jgi:hypothetical protein